MPNGHYITNSYDTVARLTQSTLVTAGGAVRNAHGYQLNLGHQRTNQVFTNATLSLAGERMGYTYDNIGQLKSAKGKQADGTTDWSGKQFGYAYDTAWNLNSRTNNGSVEPFTVDSLNQLTNTANPAEFVYDLNGNLRTNGAMVLEYDYENQLTSVQVAGSWRTEFKYDFAGRLRLRWEYTWGGTAWNITSRTRYVYDGMLVVQERTGPGNVPLVSYTRGQDLGGGLQTAGGIGGLLARTQHTGTGAGDGYYHCDGNGNVTAILAPDGNSLLAAYLFDPYGRTLESSGTWASANVYRFSSKEYHASSGLYYYGFRFYSPDLQRWLNRDPIQEAGGINLYGFVGNGPVGAVDAWGLSGVEKLKECNEALDAGMQAAQAIEDLTNVLHNASQIGKALDKAKENAKNPPVGDDLADYDGSQKLKEGLDAVGCAGNILGTASSYAPHANTIPNAYNAVNSIPATVNSLLPKIVNAIQPPAVPLPQIEYHYDDKTIIYQGESVVTGDPIVLPKSNAATNGNDLPNPKSGPKK